MKNALGAGTAGLGMHPEPYVHTLLFHWNESFSSNNLFTLGTLDSLDLYRSGGDFTC